MPGSSIASVEVVGEGRRLVEEKGVLMVYRKWVRAPPGLEPGALVEAVAGGSVAGCGLYDPLGPVALRLLEVGGCSYASVEEAVRDRLAKAYEARRRLGLAEPGSGYRLVHGDGDYMPGLVVDVYDDLAVLQLGSAAWDANRGLLVDIVAEVTGARHVYEKSIQRNRLAIGLPRVERLHRGSRAWATIREGETFFHVDARRGQKTGFFLDQRLNRSEFARLAEGRVLDLFSYTGGFGLRALVEGGAEEAVFVEEDPEAVRLLERNLELNRVKSRARVLAENVWGFLRSGARHAFDSFSVDPPAFIPRADVFRRGVAAYRRLFSGSASLVSEGGLLFLSSCSAHLAPEAFADVVAEALASAGRSYLPLGGLRGMPPDHPARPGAPHLAYLKGFFAYVY